MNGPNGPTPVAAPGGAGSRQRLLLVQAIRMELAKNGSVPTPRSTSLTEELLQLCHGRAEEVAEAHRLFDELKLRSARQKMQRLAVDVSLLAYAYATHRLPLPMPLVLVARDLQPYFKERAVQHEEQKVVQPAPKKKTASKRQKKAPGDAPVRDPTPVWRRECLAAYQLHAKGVVSQSSEAVDQQRFVQAVLAQGEAVRGDRLRRESARAQLKEDLSEWLSWRDAQRLRRLKAADEQQFLRELDARADERIQSIVRQTRDCLAKILGKLRSWNSDVFGARGGGTTGDDATMGESLQSIIFAHALSVQVPRGLGGDDGALKLKEYQTDGLRWLASLDAFNLNGILADEMGLGKTVQTVAFLLYLKEKGKVLGQHLIIAPSAVVPGWIAELRTWAPQLSVAEWTARVPIAERAAHFSEVVRRAEVVVSTYDFIRDHQQSRSREKWGRWPHLRSIKWHVIVVDEGHHISNNSSQVAVALRRFSCARKLLLTGTPLQNTLQELWALLNYLMPEVFSSEKDFEEWFQAPFGEEKRAMSAEEKTLIVLRLHKVLAPFLLRRVKADVASELPRVLERTVACEMSPLQLLMDSYVRRGAVPPAPGRKKEGQQAAAPPRASLTSDISGALRKVCNHPLLVYSEQGSSSFAWDVFRADFGGDGARLVRASGKFAVLDALLQKLRLGRHRVLVYSPWTQTLEMLSVMMGERGYPYCLLTGAHSGEQRDEIIGRFTDPNSNVFVFLVSTHAGGEGVNLQAADTVIIFESDWNPQRDKQAKARVHRLGQDKKVLCLSLVTVGEEGRSQDERKFAAAETKRRMEEKVIGAGNFNEATTDLERLDTVSSMYRNDDDDDATAKLAPQTDELDVLVARDEEELELLRSNPVAPLPLLQLNEAPEWLLRAQPELPKRRRAETVSYREERVSWDDDDDEDEEEEEPNVALPVNNNNKMTVRLKRPRPAPESVAVTPLDSFFLPENDTLQLGDPNDCLEDLDVLWPGL